MRHLVHTEPGVVEWQETDDPTPVADGVLVRPTAVSRCDLDLPMAAFGLFPGPFPVGHEFVGEVVDIGPDVSGWSVGDRVLAPFQVSCGDCDPCARDAFAACEPYRARVGAAFGFGPAGGGHPGAIADLVAVPHADHLLFAAPDLPDHEVAPLADNAIDGWRAVVPPLDELPGADVLVVGGLAASVGLFAVQAATTHGARSVTYVDDDAARLATAAELGATTLDMTDGLPDRLPRALVVVENLGTAEGLVAAVRATQPYGTCTSVAINFAGDAALPLLSMYTKGITFHTSRADARRFLPRVLDEVAAGRFRPGDLPLEVAPFGLAVERWLQPATKLVLTR